MDKDVSLQVKQIQIYENREPGTAFNICANNNAKHKI